MKPTLQDSETTTETTSSAIQLENRERLWSMFRSAPLKDAELERSLGLFVRGSLLARFLAIDDIYKRIVNLPGSIFDIGCWRGQTAVLCENLRSIYEPFNKQRRIVAFDTFSGYLGFGERDKPSSSFQDGTYSVGPEYAEFLRTLLEVHEGNNALPNVHSVHRVVAGDATKTVPDYLDEHPETLISLAFFDLGLYAPTKEVLSALVSGCRMPPGSVLVFYHLTRDNVLPGDAIAFQEVMSVRPFVIERSSYYPSISIVTLR